MCIRDSPSNNGLRLDELYLAIDAITKNTTTVPRTTPANKVLSGKKRLVLKTVGGIFGSFKHKIMLSSYADKYSTGGNLTITCLTNILEKAQRLFNHLPRQVNIDFDNANDNKCWAVTSYLAGLVHHRLVDEVGFFTLLVGHTHAPIDQFFANVSAAIRKH